MTQPPTRYVRSIRLQPWVNPMPLPGGRLQLGLDPHHRIRYAADDAKAVRAALVAISEKPRGPVGAVASRGLALLDAAGALRRDARRSDPDGDRLPVLIVQGDEPIREIVGRTLRDHGFEVMANPRLPEVFGADPGATVVVRIGRPRWEWIHGVMLRGLPHLVLSPRWDSVRVGPYVDPGRTACLRCLHLARADRDADWPWLSDRLEHQPGPPTPPGLVGVAAVSAAQILRTPDADRGNGCWIVRSDRVLPEHRAVVHHPLCGCWWPQVEEATAS